MSYSENGTTVCDQRQTGPCNASIAQQVAEMSPLELETTEITINPHCVGIVAHMFTQLLGLP